MTARPKRQRHHDRITMGGTATPAEIACDHALAPFDRAMRESERGGITCDSSGDLIVLADQEAAATALPVLTTTRPLEGPDMANHERICSIPGCCNSAYLRTWCTRHYLRWRRHGNPEGGRPTPKGEPLRWAKELVASPPSECVLWPFASNGNGYGWAFFEGKRIGAHRLVLVLATGKNPEGEYAAHGPCNNPLCVNPLHLSWKGASGNSYDRRRDGTIRAKLSEEIAKQIRESSERSADLAKRYGVCIASIQNVRAGKTWR